MSEDQSGSTPEKTEESSTVPPVPPPVNLPKPDGLNVPKLHVEGDSEGKGKPKQGRREEEATHPSEMFNRSKVREEKEARKGGCGCLSTFFMGLVLLGIAVGGTVYWTLRPFEDRGFARVNQASVVTEAPTENTIYLGWAVNYEAPVTATELCIVAGKAELGGEFSGKVYFRGGVLLLKKGAKFPAGLDVQAGQLLDEGAELEEGQPSGTVLSRE